MGSVSTLVCAGVMPSAAVELAWILDLLVQDANYADPALDELDRSLLPGIAALRPSVKRRYTSLWKDAVSGCPELVVSAASGGCIGDRDARALFNWLSTLPKGAAARRQLVSEPRANRGAVRRRLEALDSEVSLRRTYRDILVEVWDEAAGAWARKGEAIARRAASEWARRIGGATSATGLIRMLPPRHPLTRADRASTAALLRARRRFSVVPIYFCMSGGLVADLDDGVLIGVPASAHEPIRRSRDAAFVADRLQVLAEVTRVRIYIHLLSAPAAVMEISRALGISQPSVSTHIHRLVAADLVRPRRIAGRRVYVAAPHNVGRLLEDARATLTRWIPTGPPRLGPRRSPTARHGVHTSSSAR